MSKIREAGRNAGLGLGALAAIGALIIVILLIGSMWVFGYGFFIDHTANRQGESQKKELIDASGQYRVGAYEHFFDACATIQSDQFRVTNIKEALKADPKPTGQYLVTLQASYTAANQKFMEDVNQYNQDSRQSYTLARFKSADLPYQIDPTEEVTCNAS